MKGSPAKMGTIQGTAGHSSALKMRAEENASALKQRKKEYKKSPKEKVDTQREYQAKLKELENRKKEGKKSLLGDYRRKKLQKKIDKYQKNVINTDPVIQGWRKDAEKEADTKGGKVEEKVVVEKEKTDDGTGPFTPTGETKKTYPTPDGKKPKRKKKKQKTTWY